LEDTWSQGGARVWWGIACPYKGGERSLNGGPSESTSRISKGGGVDFLSPKSKGWGMVGYIIGGTKRGSRIDESKKGKDTRGQEKVGRLLGKEEVQEKIKE